MASKSNSVVDAANEYFDSLIKSRFIEMFDSFEESIPLKDVADIISGYPFESLKYTEDKTQMKICGGLIIKILAMRVIGRTR